jgi:hypothetical protein
MTHAANVAVQLKMNYWKAIGHHLLGSVSDIRDNNETVAIKVRSSGFAFPTVLPATLLCFFQADLLTPV